MHILLIDSWVSNAQWSRQSLHLTEEGEASLCKRKASHRSLDKEVQCEDADAGGHKAAPEYGCGVERSALLYGEEQAPNWRCECCCDTCQRHTSL